MTDYVEGGSMQLEAIRSGPEKMVHDKQFVLRQIINPWLSQSEKPVKNRLMPLPRHNPLVEALIDKYHLPERGKYPENPLQTGEKAPDHWSLVGRYISTTSYPDIQRIGGVLGVGEGVDTLWDVEMIRLWLLQSSEVRQKFFVFAVPSVYVLDLEPQIALAQYNKGIRPDDLPQHYLSRVKRNYGNVTNGFIFGKTKILPLDWCFAELDL